MARIGSPPLPFLPPIFLLEVVQLVRSIESKRVLSWPCRCLHSCSRGAVLQVRLGAFFGPTAFGLPQGQVDHGSYPGFVLKGANGNANPRPPTQLKAAIGAENCLSQAWAQYDFISGMRSGSPHLESIKESFNPPMMLAAGLYSQIFVWTSGVRYTVHVHGAMAPWRRLRARCNSLTSAAVVMGSRNYSTRQSTRQ